MKPFLAFVLFALAPLAAAVNPQLKQVNSVYILSMGGGMDQFLANRLTAEGVFQVVADPQKADAVLTDRLGEAFENKLDELYPAAAPKSDKPAKDGKSEASSASDSGGPAPRITSFSRGKGNLFVVDRKSRNVIWSIYERPRDFTPGELDKTAEKVVRRLKTDAGK